MLVKAAVVDEIIHSSSFWIEFVDYTRIANPISLAFFPSMWIQICHNEQDCIYKYIALVEGAHL